MTDRELLQQALDVMLAAIKAGDWKVDGACDPDRVLNAILARLAQPDKEWVGLSKAEREEISQKHKPYVADIMAAHEEELKRRNT